MLHLVNVSSGAASALCLFRVLERYGRQNTRAVFADTLGEDPDNYRFLADLERVTDFPITRLCDGRTIWEIFMHHGTITTPGRGCRATWELKRKPLEEYQAAQRLLDETTIHVGFTEDEPDRMVRYREKMAPQPVDFPCVWQPIVWRCDILDELKHRGLTPPRLYAMGYPHANCGGACVLAGNKQWAGVLKDFPDLYAKSEQAEQDFLALLRERDRTEHTILRDRRGGTVNNYSLRKMREEIESGQKIPDEGWRENTCRCTLGF